VQLPPVIYSVMTHLLYFPFLTKKFEMGNKFECRESIVIWCHES